MNGLGKTSITLDAFRRLRSEFEVSRALVVAPLRTCYSVWPREQAKWDEFSDVRVQVVHGPTKDFETIHGGADVFVTNPETLDWLCEQKWRNPPEMLVVDESTKFKRKSTQRHRWLRKLIKRGGFDRRYILTATPAPRNVEDLHGQLHILDGGESLRKLTLDRPAAKTMEDRELRYAIYQFAAPLQPKETLRLDFEVGYENPGFRDGGEKAEFAHNGTFFDSTYFPSIGYNRNFELGDDDERRDEGLAPQADLPRPDAPGVRMQNLFSQDADWIHFKATVGTSPDQIAIAPGYLQREWTENGRRYFAYDMGETKIQNFYSFISGRYVVQRDKWTGPQGDVAIEVYYDPKHPYNVARMIDSSKKGLDYFSKNFGPYQFRQYRILEFPRYRSFAQSFPNTIPYSEGIGFIAHGTEEEDLDISFYVTAHELAHQWWGHQVIGCYAQGSNMLSETLAQYSALMLMEKEEGPANIRRYLKHELDRYLRGRSTERRKEDPLGLVQRGGYIWYNKGSLVMYALKDYLGEERLNAAIRKYAESVRFQEPPYTTSLDFVAALREAAPGEMKYLLTDLFETITLFDNRVVEATWRETPEKKYLVKIRVDARKLRADELGAEKEIQIDDLVDIGVFEGEKKNERPLFLEKRRLTQSQMEFEITVDRMPTRAGIDPYNKLIDRKPDDNLVVVGKGE